MGMRSAHDVDAFRAAPGAEDSYSVLMHPHLFPPKSAVVAAVLYEPSFSTISFEGIDRDGRRREYDDTGLHQSVHLSKHPEVLDDEEIRSAIVLTLNSIATKLSRGGQPTSDAENAWVRRFQGRAKNNQIDHGIPAPEHEMLHQDLRKRVDDVAEAKASLSVAQASLDTARAEIGASDEERAEKAERLRDIEEALRSAKGDSAREAALMVELEFERRRVLGGTERVAAEARMRMAEQIYREAKSALARATREMEGARQALSPRGTARQRGDLRGIDDAYSRLLQGYSESDLARITDEGILDPESGAWALIHVSKLHPDFVSFLLSDACLWGVRRTKWDGYVYGPRSVVTAVVDALARGFSASTGLHRPYALERDSLGVSMDPISEGARQAASDTSGDILMLEFGLPVPGEDVSLKEIVRYRQENEADLAKLRHHCRRLAENLAAGNGDPSTQAERVQETIRSHLENIPPDWRETRVSLSRLVSVGATFGSAGLAVDLALGLGSTLTVGVLTSFVLSEKDAVHEVMRRRHVTRTRQQSEYAYCLDLPRRTDA